MPWRVVGNARSKMAVVTWIRRERPPGLGCHDLMPSLWHPFPGRHACPHCSDEDTGSERGSDWPEVVSHSVVSDSSATPRTAARLALSMEFSRQEYWSGLPFPPLGDFPNPGIEPRSALQVDSLPSKPPGKPI